MARPSLPPLVRLLRKAELSSKLFEDTPCVLWTGYAAKGYGRYEYRLDGLKKRTGPHRVAWETFVGEIPPGLTIDHRCKTTLCLNVAHMEVVTVGENTRRGTGGITRGRQQSAKPYCPQGHPYDEANTVITKGPKGQTWRRCRVCYIERPKA